jgi:hypothetical protein
MDFLTWDFGFYNFCGIPGIYDFCGIPGIYGFCGIPGIYGFCGIPGIYGEFLSEFSAGIFLQQTTALRGPIFMGIFLR